MLDHVKDYYGKTLNSSDDLQTDACCTLEAPPEHLQIVLSQIHAEVLDRYYGCGLVAPEELQGLRILDLGSGSGRDAYALSALVGEHGSVVGVDMTDEQLEVANRHREYHARQFGYSAPNVEFHKGYIEKLDALGFDDNSFDLIVSNCVINLSPDKQAVMEQAWRLLKPGGEMYFSDVYSDRRVPQSLMDNELLYGECLSGALYWNDFLTLAKTCGFSDPRLVEDRPLGIENEDIQALVGNIRFFSATYRLFKTLDLEPTNEDYGHTVRYKGGIDEHPDSLQFDKDYTFPKGDVIPVCSNTHRILKASRFQDYFDFISEGEIHNGAFEAHKKTFPFEEQESDEQQSKNKAAGCCG